MEELSLSSFHQTAERLQELGLDPTRDTYGIIAVGGEDFPHLPYDFLNKALMDVGTELVDTRSHSSEQQPSSAIQGENDAGREPGRGSKRVKRPHRRTLKIREYFETISVTDNRGSRTFYRCRHCVFDVTQKKQRERVFHLILCASLSLLTRTGLYVTCNDKERPPLLRYPLHHMTASCARRLVRTQLEMMVGKLDCMKLLFDPSGEPRLTRYFLDIDQVKKSSTVGKCSEEESAVATDLLLDFIIDENMPFAICDNKDTLPRPFKRLFSYLRPGYKMPSGYQVRTKLLGTYFEKLKRDVKSKL